MPPRSRSPLGQRVLRRHVPRRVPNTVHMARADKQSQRVEQRVARMHSAGNERGGGVRKNALGHARDNGQRLSEGIVSRCWSDSSTAKLATLFDVSRVVHLAAS